MYYVEQSASFECVAETGLSGLVGTISIEIIDNIGNIVDGPSTASIIEYPAGSGVYQAVRTAPAVLGQYTIVWSVDGSFNQKSTIVDDLTIVTAGSGDALPPITPIGPGPGPGPGPCNQWTTDEDIAACCNVTLDSSDTSVFDEVNSAATRTLWELSGRRYSGVCDKTVRPCGTAWCGFQVLSRGHVISPWGSFGGWGLWDGYYWGGRSCGCIPLSRVHLSGYPVREIVTVKIDGAVVDPSEYRLDEWRWLTHLNGKRWPHCQRLDLNDTEHGTFSVRYTYGQNPPEIGQLAARQLACELYKACQGATDCMLPSSVTRITRQGVSIDRAAFVSWSFQFGKRSQLRGWRTGLSMVDAFLSAYAPGGQMRRPTVWSPDHRLRYARPTGS